EDRVREPHRRHNHPRWFNARGNSVRRDTASHFDSRRGLVWRFTGGVAEELLLRDTAPRGHPGPVVLAAARLSQALLGAELAPSSGMTCPRGQGERGRSFRTVRCCNPKAANGFKDRSGSRAGENAWPSLRGPCRNGKSSHGLRAAKRCTTKVNGA